MRSAPSLESTTGIQPPSNLCARLRHEGRSGVRRATKPIETLHETVLCREDERFLGGVLPGRGGAQSWSASRQDQIHISQVAGAREIPRPRAGVPVTGVEAAMLIDAAKIGTVLPSWDEPCRCKSRPARVD